jgi:cytoskeletal protein RodZ
MNEYKIGDIANGHILTEFGWEPITQPVAAPPRKKVSPLVGLAAIGVSGLLVFAACSGGSSTTTEATEPKPAATAVEEEPTDEPTEEEVVEEAVEDEPTTVAKGDHKDISSRTWKKWAKDPDAHAGENVILWASVTQADENMGTESFRADSNTYDMREYGYWIGGENTIAYGSADQLAEVVTDDIVKMYVTVIGGTSYETTIGGTATAIEVRVNHIKVIGQDG